MEWVFGEGQADLARDYSVRAQSSWVGITGDGTLAERGSGPPVRGGLARDPDRARRYLDRRVAFLR